MDAAVGQPFSRVEKRSNNWGRTFYALLDSKEHLSVREESVCDVLWPDGTVSEEVLLVPRRYSTTVSDHGKSYSVAGYKVVARVDYRGLPIEIPVEQLVIRNVRGLG